jgi:predicted RNase H-like HicB family nuclease
MKYAIVIEKAKRNYSAYAPDIPGCISTGKTVGETKRLMREAIEFHFESMTLDGETIPESTSRCSYIDIKLPKLNGKVTVPKRRKAQAQ